MVISSLSINVENRSLLQQWLILGLARTVGQKNLSDGDKEVTASAGSGSNLIRPCPAGMAVGYPGMAL